MKKAFSHPVGSLILALVVCALWGSLFPFIKIGYNAFHIDGGDIPSVLLFAGLRFTVCGALLVAFFSAGKHERRLPARSDLLPILAVALSSIVLHYAFAFKFPVLDTATPMSALFRKGSQFKVLHQTVIFNA